VLRAQWGTPQHQVKQWRHLLTVAAQPRTQLRVLAATAPPIPGLTGHFGLLRYRTLLPVVFEERDDRIEFTDAPTTVTHYEHLTDLVRAAALDTDASEDLLQELLRTSTPTTSTRTTTRRKAVSSSCRTP
jgi:hypothetical protein